MSRTVGPFPLRVGFDLIAGESIDREVPCFRVGEVEATHTGRRSHGEAFGEFHTHILFRI